MALTDGLRRCHDRQTLVSCGVVHVEVFVMEAIDGRRLAAAQAVALGDRDVDLAGLTSLSS